MPRGDAETFAKLLADRLSEVVPKGISVFTEGPVLRVANEEDIRSGTDLEALLNQPGDLKENLTTGAYAVLSAAQDFLSEELTEPWPPVPSAGRHLFAMPGTAWEEDHLRLWYGPSDDPVLELRPLRVDD
jgi:hypothetical protein